MKRKELNKELAGMNREQLVEKLVSLSEELMKLKFKGAMVSVEQPHLVSELRRNIARVKTAIRAQALSSVEAA